MNGRSYSPEMAFDARDDSSACSKIHEITEKTHAIPPIEYSNPISRTRKNVPLAPRLPIDIQNDTAFGPSGYNFPGSGTSLFPYIISGYEIVGGTSDAININNTRVHFRISQCEIGYTTFVSNFTGIRLTNVSNGLISSNTIENCRIGLVIKETYDSGISSNHIHYNEKHGIYLENSHDNWFYSNYVYHNGDSEEDAGQTSGLTLNQSNSIGIMANEFNSNNFYGLFLSNSENITIESNHINGNEFTGLYLEQSENNTISKNDLKGNGINNNDTGSGVVLKLSHNNSIVDNDIPTNYLHAVVLEDSDYVQIIENRMASNGFGILLKNSDYNTIQENRILGKGVSWDDSGSYNIKFDSVTSIVVSNNTLLYYDYGMYIRAAETIEISNNLLYRHHTAGLILNSSTVNNQIKWNDFVVNGLDTKIQVLDDGQANEIQANFYDEYPGEIFDDPYSIAGISSNTDPSPLDTPYNPTDTHYLTRPLLLQPKNGSSHSGEVYFEWHPAIDSMGMNIEYQLIYWRTDKPSSDYTLMGWTSTHSYTWNTTYLSYYQSYEYKVVLEARSQDGGARRTTQDDDNCFFFDKMPTSEKSPGFLFIAAIIIPMVVLLKSKKARLSLRQKEGN